MVDGLRTMASSVASSRRDSKSVTLEGVDPETCMIVFKNHWAQVMKIFEKHDPFKNSYARYGSVPSDEASTVQNYVEHMLFMLIEERNEDTAMGPILEFVVTENVMEKLFLWSLRREFTDEMKIEQLKMYEMLLTQSHQPLLQHKPILKPLMMLMSSCSGASSYTVEMELVLLLNQLCSILAKDSSILELFFHTSEDQGAANFLIFSLLIPFIHREGTVGQQARDALLYIMSLSAENKVVAKHIAENTYFCPVLATGLSGLYSSLPTKLDDKGEEWHCIQRDDWLDLPPLVQFMNSLEFCNAVIQVAHPVIRNQLVNYIHNGFLVPVMAPALHKVTVEELMTTTSYLDLFLRSVTEPALLQIFLSFILLHQHDSVQILDTLVSRINTPYRLCVVSLALFRTLISLYCEDVMLQLILRYLIPCNHIMLSQRWAVRERDCYSVSAAKFLALTPDCCTEGISLTVANQEGEYVLWSKLKNSTHNDKTGSKEHLDNTDLCESACIVEYNKTVDVSYLRYLWEAEASITSCLKACCVWSAPYDGENPDPEKFLQVLAENSSGPSMSYLHQHTPKSRLTLDVTSAGEKMQLDLEWDDSYDTGMTPGSDEELADHHYPLKNVGDQPPPPVDPPKHIQEMKKNAIMLVKGSYIEDSDFQDDVIVYRLCAEKDCQDTVCNSPVKTSIPLDNTNTEKDIPAANGPVAHLNSAVVLEEQNEKNTNLNVVVETEHPNEKNINLNQLVEKEKLNLQTVKSDLEQETEAEPDHNLNLRAPSPDSEDIITQYDDLIKDLDSNPTNLEELKPVLPELITPMDEEEDDFDRFSVGSPQERVPSPFGPKSPIFSNNPARIQGIPFTGPFISVLMSKLENMPENSLHVNLLLTGIFAQLACYPQPLLRSFLLNTNVVFQPSVRSLYQVLASVKNKIDQISSSVDNFVELLKQAQQYLLSRVDKCAGAAKSQTKGNQTITAGNIKPKQEPPPLPNIPSHVRNAVFAAVIFSEFLKELAAIAQEHSILCYKPIDGCEE
ncbi:FHF complex subunit HOOK interacting protein 1A [Protopterus annectens]|uniref:FHF complex subunit HOOK interacting protein 1A n=1 Tax=Protopterus annectens TaxID=7888 RepID=UPI001CFA2D85|nr:FHF complex subunit HOOK interacting protein 1A [Protopterus annectens]